MKVYSIVVIYNPEKETLLSLVTSLIKQSVNVVIVNNGPALVFLDELLNLNAVEIINNDGNLGIATAQNIGISKVKSLGATHVVFFDQDSVINIDTISKLYCRYDDLSKKHNVAAVGPIYEDSDRGFIYPVIKLNKFGFRKRITPSENSGVIPVSFIISSGMFTSVDVLNMIGAMNDLLFIDYVDTEWCLRAASENFVFFVDTNILMKHSIGDESIKILKWNFPVHSPFRRYYRIRNAYLLFRLGHVPLILKIREVIINFLHQIIIIVYSKHKMKQAISWWSATKDGLKKVIFGC